MKSFVDWVLDKDRLPVVLVYAALMIIFVWVTA